jgi:hypothetical protein
MFTYLIDEDGNVILRSPSSEEKYLTGEDKQYFLEDVGYIEESDSEVEKKVSDLIENYYWD